MIGRCSGKWKNPFTYSVYGKHNIKVCEEWLTDFEAFYRWAIKNNYEPGLVIDRIDTYGDYNPSNCRFITHKENCRNRTNTRYYTHNGVERSLAEWADIYELPLGTLYYRVVKQGWPFEKAISTPIKKRKKVEPKDE